MKIFGKTVTSAVLIAVSSSVLPTWGPIKEVIYSMLEAG